MEFYRVRNKEALDCHELHACNLGLSSVSSYPSFIRWILCTFFDYTSYSLQDGKGNSRVFVISKDNLRERMGVSSNIELNAKNVNALVQTFFALDGKPLEITDEVVLGSSITQEIAKKHFLFWGELLEKDNAYNSAEKIQIITSATPRQPMIRILRADALAAVLIEDLPGDSPIPEICASILSTNGIYEGLSYGERPGFLQEEFPPKPD